MLETIHLPHLPLTLPIHLILYHSLQNGPFLRQQLLTGNTDFEYAFIDAKTIISRRHILAACFRALNDHMNGRLKSRNLHSEIVCALGGNNNIGESFRRFGIQDSTTELLVVKVGTSSTDATQTTSRESVERHLRESIQGVAVGSVDDETLAGFCDVVRVGRAYKVPTMGEGTGQGKGKGKRGVTAGANPDVQDMGRGRGKLELDEQKRERDREQLERAALGAMALRGAA